MYVLFSLCFSLDPEQKEMLIEVIEKLLKDKSTVSNIFLCLSTIIFHLHSIILLLYIYI